MALAFVVYYEGVYGIPEFLSEEFYNAIWHGEYSHTWSTIRAIISCIFVASIIVFIYNIGKSIKNDDEKPTTGSGLSMG